MRPEEANLVWLRNENHYGSHLVARAERMAFVRCNMPISYR